MALGEENIVWWDYLVGGLLILLVIALCGALAEALRHRGDDW